ncbi:MAG: hypothetical protein ABI920_14035 [Casimicrobiaceae bacterium]
MLHYSGWARLRYINVKEILMNTRFSRKLLVLAVGMVLPALALAADKPATHSAPADTVAKPMGQVPQAMPADAPRYSDRTQMKQWSSEKEQLENVLKTSLGKDRGFARQEIERQGFRITSVNKETPGELEYEVVKGHNSYEVQFDFDKGTVKKVDVSTNMWKAESTKKALKDANYKYDYPKTASPASAAYSDRARMKTWTNEKERLEKSLAVDQSKDYYRKEIVKHGYKIAAVNEDKQDYIEYEIVKGDNSYEVQVDFDKATGKSKKVDVTSNLWENEKTDRMTDKGDARKEARVKN